MAREARASFVFSSVLPCRVLRLIVGCCCSCCHLPTAHSIAWLELYIVCEGCLVLHQVFGVGKQRTEEGSRALWLLLVTCIAEALNSKQAK